MLKTIRLKNFKLHEDTTIEAGKITVFIGPNNSGKSSIFQALLVLKQAGRRGGDDRLVVPHRRESATQEQPFLYAELHGPIVDLGGYRDVVRDPSRELQIGADVELPPDLGAIGTARDMGVLQVGFDVWFRENCLIRHGGSFACAYGQTTRWVWDRGGSQPAETVKLTIPRHSGELIVKPGDRLNALIDVVAQFKQPPLDVDLSTMTSELRRSLNHLWSQFLSSFRPVHQLRGFEEWEYPTINFPAHESLDRLVLSDRAVALTNLLAANAKLRREISARLKSLVGVGIEFETASAHRVKVWATSGDNGTPTTLFVSEGSGANQLPFILVPIALAKPGETILVPEPEAHLYPKRQSELSAMLLEISRKAELQFFIETHSEHVLHVILNAVGKGECSKDDVAIYYFEEPVDGVAHARRLEVNEHGQVDGGLPGFFEQSLTELTDYLDAVKKT